MIQKLFSLSVISLDDRKIFLAVKNDRLTSTKWPDRKDVKTLK